MCQTTSLPQHLTPLHPNCFFLFWFCIKNQPNKNAFHVCDWNKYIYIWNSHRLHFQGFPSQNIQLILQYEEQLKADHKSQKSSKLRLNLLQGNKGIKTAASDAAYVELSISSSQEGNWSLDYVNLLARRTHIEWIGEGVQIMEETFNTGEKRNYSWKYLYAVKGEFFKRKCFSY